MYQFEMTGMGAGTLPMTVRTIDRKDYTEDVIERFGMKGYNPTRMSGVEPVLFLNQLKKPNEQKNQEAS